MRHTGLIVRSADSGAGHRAFVTLPYRLYAGDPNWAPPLRSEERHRWSLARNASLRDRWARRFVAYRDGRPVGRVAAIEDRGFARNWEAGTGWFGFFECQDDPVVAQALMDAAEDALRQRGLEAVIGPVNLTTHDETGVLVDGFDAPASLMTPYNPPYYDRLLHAAGYTPANDYYAYRATLVGDVSPAVERLVRSYANGKNRGIRIRPLDLKNWNSEARTIWSLYNRAFESVWGFVPIAWDEFAPRAKRFRQFAVPELVPIAEVDGEPVGFALVLPDINEALRGTNGRLIPFGWLHIARAVPRIRAFRFILLGVLPEHRGSGVGALIAFHVRETARHLGVDLELSLVQQINDPVRHVIDAFDCPITKTYRLYKKQLRAAATSGEAAA
jgi:GNAT superfamily N-acetyltransferase